MKGGFFFETALLPQGWLPRVRVSVDDGRITSVEAEASAQPDDLREPVALPGLPNVHSHAFQRAMAGLAERRGPDHDSFWTWREVMYRFLGRLDPDMVEAVAAYAYADMLEAGFTRVGEFHYLHRAADGGLYDEPAELALRHLAASATTGIGMTLLPVFYAHAGFGGTAPTPGQARFITDIDLFSRILETCRAAPGTTVGVAPHSLRAVTPQELAQVVALADGGPIHVHAAEQLKEVEDCLAWSGQRPVEWLLAHQDIDARWCLVHATHLSPAELDGLARSQAVAGLCPITEANLGDGVFEAATYLEAGGRWGVGTDSNISIDAAGELRQLEYAQRLARLGRNVLAPGEGASTGRSLLEGALAGGGQALGVGGSIAPGARADFVCLAHTHPDLEGRSQDQLLDAWVFVHGRRLVDRVYAGGRLVVEGGRHRLRDRIDARYRAAVSALA